MEKLITWDKATWELPHIIRGFENLKEKAWDKVLTCLTWARPSGRLHLGHYVWALNNWIKLQECSNVKTNFLIADYQVLWDHLWETEILRASVIDMVIDWLAVWLDPEKSNFIVQSYVPEFAELFNYLTMFVPYSLATNNPTLKEEMKKIESRESENNSISLGFINYPVSQVADIMLLWWEIVPVWEDQIPHIELSRKVIKKINTMYGTNFPIPKVLVSETPRLVWIDGNNKMSKSLGNTIYLTATPKEIKEQVNKMYTDPGKINIDSKWDISNHVAFMYLDIFYKNKEHLDQLKKRYVEWWPESVGDWEIKKLLIEVLEEFISPIRERREYYKNHMDIVVASIEKWSKNARAEWQKLIRTLREAMGLVDYWKEYL
ncbi:MAG: tryptophanyl-tRNA synthetase [uncultured bacterium (gcode 4)]|uniref:Tryptophan--tRNA ligase n=1 Tax=uncultured bacterium (gcode 4) TaxID=1234023 RepID=K2G2I6_9BACT|nr:MAG: tryptophanyl-tRNA synthetase [uncultured bacterium (gcode 4)]